MAKETRGERKRFIEARVDKMAFLVANESLCSRFYDCESRGFRLVRVKELIRTQEIVHFRPVKWLQGVKIERGGRIDIVISINFVKKRWGDHLKKKKGFPRIIFRNHLSDYFIFPLDFIIYPIRASRCELQTRASFKMKNPIKNTIAAFRNFQYALIYINIYTYIYTFPKLFK